MLSTNLTSIVCPFVMPFPGASRPQMSVAEGEKLPLAEGYGLIEPPVEVSPYRGRGWGRTSGRLLKLAQGPSVCKCQREALSWALLTPKAVWMPKGRSTDQYQGHGGAWAYLRVGTAAQKSGHCFPDPGCDVMGGLQFCAWALGSKIRHEFGSGVLPL